MTNGNDHQLRSYGEHLVAAFIAVPPFAWPRKTRSLKVRIAVEHNNCETTKVWEIGNLTAYQVIFALCNAVNPLEHLAALGGGLP